MKQNDTTVTNNVKKEAGVLHVDKQSKNKQDSAKQIVSTPDKDYLTGRISFSKDSRFVKIDPKHCNGRTVYVRTEVAEAFEDMRKNALKDSIVLFVLSGARTFEQQKNIWERKWKIYQNLEPQARALKILAFSSMPMSSRHHWGTDIDMNSLENSYFEKGKGLKIYQWLTEHALKYGFCQVYNNKNINNRTGYEMEKWHWSYLPISHSLLEQYNNTIQISDFKGFSGCETAEEVKIIDDYVNGINSECK
ncbi:MAG: M15 family metallopeptidase [Prevotellaceae bacterium]|nr:M15 family metallopeptidase [Prevotellaceae bacterium]